MRPKPGPRKQKQWPCNVNGCKRRFTEKGHLRTHIAHAHTIPKPIQNFINQELPVQLPHLLVNQGTADLVQPPSPSPPPSPDPSPPVEARPTRIDYHPLLDGECNAYSHSD